MRAAVIGGGQSSEHEVSLASAAAVAGALDPSHYEVVRLTISRDGSWFTDGKHQSLAEAVTILQSCDVALPVLHGPRGEDGTLAALLDLAGVPYVGSGVAAGAIAMDKWVTKLVAEAIGIRTARGELLTTPDYSFQGPVVVKPVAAGSSHGVSLVTEADALAPALKEAFAHDSRVLVEEVIDGREIDVAVLDGLASPPLEIAVDGLFDYETKYGGEAHFLVPAPLTTGETTTIQEHATAMFRALGCRGVARVDFFLTDDGPVLNEVNTMPGFTAYSQVPRMFAAAGISYPDLLDRMVRACLAP